jgi:hypothetical protein
MVNLDWKVVVNLTVFSNLKDNYQINNEKPLFGGVFVCTLLAISYSNLRGMMYNLWKDTYLNSLILSIINVLDLLKSKRQYRKSTNLNELKFTSNLSNPQLS